jgi:hypothetical protein
VRRMTVKPYVGCASSPISEYSTSSRGDGPSQGGRNAQTWVDAGAGRDVAVTVLDVS